MKLLKIFITSILINLSIFLSLSFSEIVKKIEISGNDRISEKTILIFSEIKDPKNAKFKPDKIKFSL